jgi:predicted nucleic acid-binding protein
MTWATRFADTSFLIALAVPSDQDHVRAQEWFDRWDEEGWSVVTTEAVLIEFLNALSQPVARLVALRWFDFLRQEPSVKIIQVDAVLFEQAVQLYRARPDKSWGLTDCISFTVMDQQGITEALSADRHFVQAGYQALLL